MTTQLQHPSLQHPSLNNAPAATQYPADVANFNLLISRNRPTERAPHYFGSFKLDGKWYQVSTWIAQGRTVGSEQYLSNAIRPCTPEEAAKHEAREAQFQARARNNVQPQATQQAIQYQAATPMRPEENVIPNQTPAASNPLDHEPSLPPLPEGYDPRNLPITDPRHPDFTPF